MSKTSGSRLGKGLSALFGEETQSILKEIESGKNSEYVSDRLEIEIAKIVPNPYQPRKEFDEASLTELKDSILQHGLLSPILVRKGVVGYELIAGERRLRAAKLASLEKLPAIVVDFNDTEMMEVSIIENIQRQDLNVIEEAQAYSNLMDKLGYTQDEIAKKMNKSRSHITNLVRLLKLPDEVLQLVLTNQLSMGHVRPLITLDSQAKMIEIAKKAVAQHLSVRQVENLVKEKSSRKLVIHKQPKKEYLYPIQLMEKKFLTKATIDKNEIKIQFSDTDDLNRILELMGVLEEY